MMGGGGGGTADEVRAWLARALPDRKKNIASVSRLGEGLENVVWLVDDELVVRVAKNGAPGKAHREATLLTLISEVSPIPTPRVVLEREEEGILVCTYLAGVSLLNCEAPPSSSSPMAKQLGELLTVLHDVPSEKVVDLVNIDSASPHDWLVEAHAQWPAVQTMVPSELAPQVDHFLLTAPPASIARDRFVLCHNDLGSEHLIVDPAHADLLTGVIDWSDAALADPAVDFSRLYRDFGRDFTERLRAHYTRSDIDDEAAWQRIVFYARCSVIEDLAFAANDERLMAYRQAALRSMRDLFSSRR